MKLLKVLKWEFLKTVKTKQFLVMTVLIPLLMGAFGGLPILIQRWSVDRGGRQWAPQLPARDIVVIDETGMIYPELVQKQAGMPERLMTSDQSLQALRSRLEEGQLDGILVIGADVLEVNAVRFYSRDLGALEIGALRQALTEAITARRLARAGYESAAIRASTEDVRIVPVLITVEGRGYGAIGVPLGLTMLLVFGAMFSGVMVMQSVIKEKSDRVVELVLSSISADDLMMGKTLAYGAAGLIQITVWGGIAFAVAHHYLGISLADLSWVQLATYPFYFALGYLLFAALYAAQGAVMADAQSGSQLQGFVVILPMIPVMLAGTIVLQPDLPWVRAFSFVPPFTPATMMLRMAVGQVPWWEITGSLAVLTVFVYLLIRFATKVFEVGLLMYGKPATLKEIWRWGVQSFRRSET
ncbi:TPA: hypothetical protein DCY65_02655 [Candidatus Acetothermia bacterium]|nr:hypothetical protein [Candidatus Acetothermia bacterium]